MAAPLRDQNAQLRQQVADLRVEIATAQGKGTPRGPSRVATARAEVEAQMGLIVELKAMLAEARRPWWRRWLQ